VNKCFLTTRLAAIAAVTIALLPLDATATTLNFSDLTSGSCHELGATVNSGGFHFSGAGDGLFLCNSGVVQSNQSNSTPAMVDANGLGVISLSQVGGASFSLQSFFAGSRTDGYGQATGIDIVGTQAGGGTISDVISFSGFQWNQYILPTSFTGLSSVTFTTTGPGRNNEFVFNDIVVNAAPAGVPEPAAMALLGVGLLGTGVMVRRRGQSATVPTAG
jgi:hypothetical protein